MYDMSSQSSDIGQGSTPVNPHFDHGRVVWDDSYSGLYQPPPTGYHDQFELQWKLAHERFGEYYKSPGSSIDDEYIDDRIYEWTGKHPKGGGFRDSTMAQRTLDRPLDPALIKDKSCIDIACGLGRWTKTMLRLGAKSVLSIDISQSALDSVSTFNKNVRRVNIVEIPAEQPDLVGKFEFGCFWGVAMCTHDPRKAFMSAASTIAPGGSLYLMVYAPEGLHGRGGVNTLRKTFHRELTSEERLPFVEKLYRRELDSRFPLSVNLYWTLMRLLGRPNRGRIIGFLDMLAPYYNWVIPLPVIRGWMKDAGFETVVYLNEFEKGRCAYHVLGTKAPAKP